MTDSTPPAVAEPDVADRVAATRRPEGAPVMRQDWWDLLFLHWKVKPDVLRRRLPPALDLDTFEGRAYVGIVPFTVSGARLSWLPPLPFLSSFHEVNLRTYVHRRGGDPGVWFFSLDASSALAAQAARLWYRLPYRSARIEFEVAPSDPAPNRAERRWIRFSSKTVDSDPPDFAARYGPAGAPEPAAPGTLEYFLVERYALYTVEDDHLLKARVFHQPYPLQPAAVESWQERLFTSAGLDSAEGEPLAHYARGVNVEVFPPRRV